MTYTTRSAEYMSHLQDELLRVTSVPGVYHTFKLADGTTVQGATESDVKEHLVGRDGVKGRQHRFPGITNGLEFGSAVEAAGFRFVAAKNYRNQPCTIITL
jgi:hypothetical protein